MLKTVTAFLCALGVLMGAHAVEAAEATPKTFVVITSQNMETQGMALVLSLQALQNGSEVRILLCDHGGDIALKDYKGTALKPRNVTPQQLLKKALSKGATADVCALYLPNRDLTADVLIPGVSGVKPPQIGQYMADPSVRYFTF